VSASRAGYLPALSLDYFYGIDATRFATRTDGIPNLGSSVVATLDIPIWNWGATQSKVKQAELRRDQAKRELSLAQRKLLADLQTLYAEADTASSELASLSRSAELAAESLRLTTLRYKDGESTVLEVVDRFFADHAGVEGDGSTVAQEFEAGDPYPFRDEATLECGD